MALAGITAHIDSALANTTDNLAFMGTLKELNCNARKKNSQRGGADIICKPSGWRNRAGGIYPRRENQQVLAFYRHPRKPQVQRGPEDVNVRGAQE